MSTQRREENRRRRTKCTGGLAHPAQDRPGSKDELPDASYRRGGEPLRVDYRSKECKGPVRQNRRRGAPHHGGDLREADCR